MKKDNISSIKSFVNSSKTEVLILNKVNDEINQFYLYVINFFAKKERKKLNINPELSRENDSFDLFNKEEIKIFDLTSSKKIEDQVATGKALIIFSDYKNFKKYSNKLVGVNCYEFEKDINHFIRDVLSVNNLELIKYCKMMPQLTFSETSKFLINDLGYIKDQSIEEKNNFILDIRKSLFNLKREGNDIKKSYLMHKKEVVYKKFNFLTF